MKTFTRYPSRLHLGLILKIIITTIWLLCIASAAWAAPGLGQQPVSQSACSGTNPSFTVGSVTVTSGPATIQWQVSINGSPFANINDGATYSGTTTVTLTFPNVSTTLNGNVYRCMVTEGTETTISNSAVLTVNATPAVEYSPKRILACVGFRPVPRSVGSVPNAAYQWQISGDNGTSWNNVNPGEGYLGSTTQTLTYPAFTSAMNGKLYRYRITVGTCSNSSAALDSLTVSPLPVWATPYPGPIVNEICPGDDISFTDNATGVAPILYKWQMQPNVSGSPFTDVVDNAVYSGSQTNTLQITDFNGAQGTSYYVRLTANYAPPYVACNVNTRTSLLSVRTLPAVFTPPADVSACANSNAQFTVAGSGSEQLNYQWQTDNGTAGVTWTNVGSNSDVLPVNGITTAMNGWKYRVTVSNDCAPPAASNAVTLTVRRSGVWLGTTDTRWEEPQNWCGGVPDNTIDVLVPNFLPPHMPDISNGTGTAYFKSLEIENEARLTISGGAVDNILRASNLYTLSGTVAYTATGNQEVFPANHGSLEINGTGNKFLNSHVDVSNNLVLGGSAKLATRTNILTMKNGSTMKSGNNPIVASAFTAPATSWIVTGNGNAGAGNTGLGGLRIEQLDATDGVVVFPVGPTAASYNPLRLINSGSTDNFTVAVNDQLIPGGVFDAGVNRTWLLSETVPGASNIMLALRWQSGEEHTGFDRTRTQIIRSSGVQIVESTNRAAAGGPVSGPFFSVDGAFSILTQFSVASSVVTLPVELKSFNVQKAGNAAVGLNWTTGATMPDYFNVQRSTDGVRFTTIGKVNGENGKAAYNYTDNLPGTGTVYYRLQVVMPQNEIVYSGVQSVVLNNANQFQLRPSATTGAVTNVYVQTASATTVKMFVSDISGHIHSQQSLQLNKGEHLLPLWIGGLNKGVYYVHVKDGNGNTNVMTFVKQ